MNEPIYFTDGQVGSLPIVISRALYTRIEHLAAQAGMEAAELIQLAILSLFDKPGMSSETLANLIRHLEDQS